MNGAQREIEVKRLLVGERAGDRLLAALRAPVEPAKHQVNHFFDTADAALRRARCTLRLRFEDGAPILTAKGPSLRVSADTAAKLEAEARIEPALAEAILLGRADLVTELRARVTDGAFADLWSDIERSRGGAPLRRLGSFENQRRTAIVPLPQGLTLRVEVDRTRFPDGGVDEEVEIELPSPEIAGEVERWLEAAARAAGVVTAPSSPKIARFLQRLAAG